MRKVNEKCTSCGACLNRCPKNAISFQKVGIQEVAVIDEKKCINCGKCFKLCPNKKKKEHNKIITKVARIKNTDNIKKSASGGIFGEFARLVIFSDGVVYGAAFSGDYKSVHHIRCTRNDDLKKILKSKYVRSDLKETFKQAEQDLKDGKLVLFSGTPCQIAGLKSFLGKDYLKLFTIDVICHGTPSPIIWKKYAEQLEKEQKSIIKKADFRYYNDKDILKSFYIEFDNGNIINERLYDTSYGRAFSIGLINGESCGHCIFNDFRNYSDITLADAWGYNNEEYPNNNSLIIINTKKGYDYYNNVKNGLIEFDDFDLEKMLQTNYPILHPTLEHYNYGKVRTDARNIDKELWYWLDEYNGLVEDKNGVGILNFSYENINFGANLVAYSLSTIVKRLNYKPYIIDFDVFKDLDGIKKYQSLNFYKFRRKYLNMTPKFKNKDNLPILNKYYDMFITGSDQVWRKYITAGNYSTYFLDFVHKKNKISYGASFGNDEYDGDIIDQLNAISNISAFYKVSVRENGGVNVCKEKLLRDDAEVVLDPTLLLTADDYKEINDDAYNEKIDVAVYLMLDSKNKKINNKEFKRLFPNKKIVNIKGEYIREPIGNIFVYNHISKWLDGIRKSEYVVTDSYHGLVFSLIFHKKVICIGKNSSSYSRFSTLIENLGGNIDKIMFDTLKSVKSIRSISNVLNYDIIDDNINKLREKSLIFLKKGLKKENIKEENVFHKEIANEILMLKNEVENLKSNKEELYSILNSKSWKITEPLRIIKSKISGKK